MSPEAIASTLTTEEIETLRRYRFPRTVEVDSEPWHQVSDLVEQGLLLATRNLARNSWMFQCSTLGLEVLDLSKVAQAAARQEAYADAAPF